MDNETILNLVEEPPEDRTVYYAVSLVLDAIDKTLSHFMKDARPIGFDYYDCSVIPIDAGNRRDSYLIVGVKETDHLTEKLVKVWVDRHDFEEKLREFRWGKRKGTQ